METEKMRGLDMVDNFGPVGTNSPDIDQQDLDDLDAVREGRRERALEMAIEINRGNLPDRDSIVKDAKAFEAYLKNGD
jgi:hypothetical protein